MGAAEMTLPHHAGRWQSGSAPVAVIMITLNESHQMVHVLENLQGWAREVFIVDSFSRDYTVDIALQFGATVVQREFKGFGDQWNFALRSLPISSPWTMKMDPDERLTIELKEQLSYGMNSCIANGFSFDRRLWFMGAPLPVRQRVVRLWQTGKCHFTDVAVNEHPIVDGMVCHLSGEMEHHDSPDLEHWIEKQNRYTTAEALIAHDRSALADVPRLFGSSFQRRMWMKRYFNRVPFRFALLFLYHWLIEGSWRAGWPGYAWARLRAEVMRLIYYKQREMALTGRLKSIRSYGRGFPDGRVAQYE